ncbi:MAG: DUF3021 domain-containing protein [Clostridia bacterium]|nr:DUF3021 domain-containing protein [Clostridia bacterium]
MKQTDNFITRGLWGAWIGPFVVAIVYLCIYWAGAIETVAVPEVCVAVISSVFMGFLAAGISFIYTCEKLSVVMRAAIHAAVLYFDYLGFYLLNGFLPTDALWIFTAIFFAGFILIWFIVYASIRSKTARLNRALAK